MKKQSRKIIFFIQKKKVMKFVTYLAKLVIIMEIMKEITAQNVTKKSLQYFEKKKIQQIVS